MRVALLIGVVLLAFAPAAARAGTYDVTLCADAAATGFTAQTDDPVTLTATATCPPPANDPTTGVYLGVLPGTTWPTAGASAAWTVAAPTGTTLRSLTVQRRIEKPVVGYEVAVVTAEGATLDGCIAAITCNGDESRRTYPATRAITFRLRCAMTTPCPNSPGSPKASLVVRSAQATIEDPVAPTVAAPAVPAGWQRAATATFGAEDNTGVRTLVLRDGAATLDTRAQTCDFRHLQPCPLKVAGTVAPELADGVHSLTVVATDAGGETATSAAALLRIDRTAPTAPLDLTVTRGPDGSYLYSWRNPDQTGSPIAAAHLSDGTVVRGANITTLTALTGDARLYLEDEAGNTDARTATGVTQGIALGVQKPILRTTADPARLKITSAKRSGTKLIVKGTIAKAITAKLTATVARGSRSAKGSAKAAGGRFTIKVSLSSALRRKGTNTLTVRFAGQGNFGTAAVNRKLTVR